MVMYMVNAMINISEEANQIFNIVKAKHNLKDKSEAIDFVAKEYGNEVLEPELRPDFIERIKKAEKGKFIKVSNFAKHYGVE